jgi:hypothetical protein
MPVIYGVKGSTVRTKFEYVRQRFGEEDERLFREHFKDRSELQPLLDVSWISFRLYDELNCYIAEKFFGGDMSRLQEVGTYSAERALQTTYRAFARGKDFLQFLDQMREYVRAFYNVGDLLVEVGDNQKSAIVKFRKAPEYTLAELHMSAGFFVGAGRLMGLSDITCRSSLSRQGIDLDLRWG